MQEIVPYLQPSVTQFILITPLDSCFSIRMQLKRACISDLDHSTLYWPLIKLNMAHFNQDRGLGSRQSNRSTAMKSNLFWPVWPPWHQLLNQCFNILLPQPLHDGRFFFVLFVCFLLNVLSTPEYLPTHSVQLLRRKASGVAYWINTTLSILSMQIEIEVLHLPLDFRKA